MDERHQIVDPQCIEAGGERLEIEAVVFSQDTALPETPYRNDPLLSKSWGYEITVKHLDDDPDDDFPSLSIIESGGFGSRNSTIIRLHTKLLDEGFGDLFEPEEAIAALSQAAF